MEFRFTHGSFVFLTERDAFKVKRAKDYGFFDYSTLEARKHFCDEELRLNRRTAPDVYVDVLPVYLDELGHSLTRSGEIVDYAVHMVRLPDERSALALLERGELAESELTDIAQRVARFQNAADKHPPAPAALKAAIAENFEQTQSCVGNLISKSEFETIRELQQAWLEDNADLLSRRECRDGHGDLRLEHVYLLNGKVVIIDCIEFLADFRIEDPALDASFLAMDLYQRQHNKLAEHFLARFCEAGHDFACYPLLNGYMSYRAYVRGKVAAFVATDVATPKAQATRKAEAATELFALADTLMRMARKRVVIAVGGMIASGKSTVAAELGQRLPAPVISADATRKFLAGVPEDEAGSDSLYTDEFNRRVQNELLARLESVIRGNRPVILDTTLRSREFRLRLRQQAVDLGAEFLLVECRVPEFVARERLQARDGGVSDAREDLLAPFMDSWQTIDELPEQEHVIVDGTAPLQETVGQLVQGPLAGCQQQ